jgi:hypothetical protein
MLLKWLFTLLAILWLYEAIVRIQKERNNRMKPPRNQGGSGHVEYTDYEELK